MSDDDDRVAADARLTLTPARNRTFNLPDLVSELVDDLVEQLTSEGFAATRSDVVAALVLKAQGMETLRLEQAVRNYRLAEVASVAAHRVEEGEVTLRPLGHGPRPMRGA